MSKAWVNRLGFGQIGAAAPPPCLIRTYEILRNFGIFLLSNFRTRELYRPIGDSIASPPWTQFSLRCEVNQRRMASATSLSSPSQDLRKSFGNFLHCSIPRRRILKRDGEWNNEKVVQKFHKLIFCHNALCDITIITSMFYTFQSRQILKKTFPVSGLFSKISCSISQRNASLCFHDHLILSVWGTHQSAHMTPNIRG